MSDSSGGGIGFLGVLLVGLILLGILGYGPCADSCRNCGPRPTQTEGAK